MTNQCLISVKVTIKKIAYFRHSFPPPWIRPVAGIPRADHGDAPFASDVLVQEILHTTLTNNRAIAVNWV
eukprot:5712570-Pleurochrysis_carterae.AAC.2